MFSYNVGQLVEVFELANNMNAAVKKLLREEVNRGDPAEKFLKRIRGVLASKTPGALERFLEEQLPKYESCVFPLVASAHRQAVQPVVDEIIARYADEFNRSYEQTGEDIEYRDRAAFERIVAQVNGTVEAALKEKGLPVTGAMKNAVMSQIFDPAVLKEAVAFLSSE